VLPQNAEWALDCALSGVHPSAQKSTPASDDTRLILTDLTRRGAVRGSLGDVMFFPWSGRGHIVLAGMGRLGTFKEPQLRILASSVVQTVGRLIKGANISIVLIGAGFGNLKVEESVTGLLSGAAAALKADPTLDISTLRIVEARIDRAYEILKCVQDQLPAIEGEYGVALGVEAEVVERDGEFAPTGRLAPTWVHTSSQEHVIAGLVKALRDHPLRSTVAIPVNLFAPVPTTDAFPYPYEDMGLLSWISQPYYLLSAEDTLDKIEVSELDRIAETITGLVKIYMALGSERLTRR